MNKHILILVFYFLSLSYQVAAQGGKIVGVVTDADNGQPLIGCSIFIENLMLCDATDSDGNYLILNIPSGTHTVKAQMVGYNSQIIEGVKVSSGLTITFDFKLSAETI